MIVWLLKHYKLARFVLSFVPSSFFLLVSRLGAERTFKRAINLPGYAKFLNDNGVSFPIKTDFNKVPITDKDNYIKKNNLLDISYNNVPSFLYRSSGFSGEPIFWSQSIKEVANFFAYVEFNFKNLFQINKKRTLVISMFSLSSWITGQQTLNALNRISMSNRKFTYFACGIEIDEGLSIIKKYWKEYDQIIIMSYPLTIKVLLEKMIEDVEDELREKIIIIVGAEGVTYEWCKYIEKIVRKKNKKDRYIYSAFGAADIGIGFGAEQLSCLILKDLLYENIQFRKNLLGREDMPLHVFQYNPIGAYVEEVNGDFVLTMDKQVPLVRYNLKDSIKIFTYDDLKMVMKKTNIDWNSVFRNRQVFRLPFVVVYGRSDDTIILNGANIYLSSFKEVLQHGELSKYHTGKFRVFVVEDEMLFQNYKVQIELKDDVIASDKLKNMFRTRIVNFLLENDKGYKFAYHQPYASDIACIIEFAPFDEKATKHKYK